MHDVRGGHVGVDEHSHVEAPRGRGESERLGQHRRGDGAHLEPPVLLRPPEREHADGSHLLEDLAGDLAVALPFVDVGAHLCLAEGDDLVGDGAEVVVDEGVVGNAGHIAAEPT